MGKWVSWLILKIEMGHLGGWCTWVMRHMGQRAIMVNTEDRDGVPWVMGHMDNGHMVNMWSCAGSCATSLILHGSLQKNLLYIDIDVFYLNIL